MPKAKPSLRCRWKGCTTVALQGSHFCAAHVIPPPTGQMPQWIRDLPASVGVGLATSVLYDMLKIFTETVLFHDNTAAKVDGMMARLQMESLAEISVPEVADFIDMAKADPGFARDMERALRESRIHQPGADEA